jgi:divalent metal cation (Fe/Co/Zn/Cd) transporter
MTNAWHHRSDAISSGVALVGVLGAQLGLPILDPIAGLCVSLLIMRMGSNMLFSSLQELTDESHADANRAAETALLSVRESIVGHLPIRTRRVGPNSMVDLRIFVDPNMPVSSAHQIAERLRTHIMHQESSVKDVLVHVTPPGWEASEVPVDKDSLPRPYAAVECDVRTCVSDRFPHSVILDNVRCHYDAHEIVVDVALRTPSKCSAPRYEKLALDIREHILSQVRDVHEVRVLVDFTFDKRHTA